MVRFGTDEGDHGDEARKTSGYRRTIPSRILPHEARELPREEFPLGTMVERTISLAGFHPMRFFAKLSPSEKNVAYVQSGEWTIIAWNPQKTMKGHDAKVFDELKKIPRVTSALPFAGGAIGFCSYELGLRLRGVESRHPSVVPGAIFHVYEHALLWNGVSTVCVGDQAFEAQVRAIHERPFVDIPIPAIEWSSRMKKSEYRKKFTAAMHGIRSGDFYQLNLSYPFSARSNVDKRQLFASLLEANPAPSASFFEQGDFSIISLSPERFVHVEKGVVTTCPIKGTRPRGRTQKEDERAAAELLRSPKEEAELNMITDLLRNDVGKISVAGSVHVVKHRVLQKNPSVWHTYSMIRGTMAPSLHPIEAFASMFPGGSVTGCPKVSAMEEIDRLEIESRGAYCGSMVMLSSSGSLDSSILIRTIVAKREKLSLSMGGGIVSDSDAAREYDETLRKGKPFFSLSHSVVSQTMRGRGVFETMAAYGGKIFQLSAHLTRLQRSADLVGISIPPRSALRKRLHRALKGKSGSLRVRIVCATHVTIDVRPYRADPRTSEGVRVTILPLDRRIPEAKALPYDREIATHDRALRQGFHEALLRRSDGCVVEGAYSNVFFVKDRTLWTAEHDMLPGITRSTVIRLARTMNIPVRFVSLQELDLFQSDEIFLTSTLQGVVPVTTIDTECIGNGKPGPITRRLQKAFEATRR